MRLLISADIHLGSPIRSAAMRNPELGDQLQRASRDTFASIIGLAIAEQVDALVLAGDIFDSAQPDLKARAFLITQLTRAAEAGIPTVLIRGNHDALLGDGVYGDLGPMVHLLDKGHPNVEIGGVMFHGLSFNKAHFTISMLPDYPVPVPGRKNVGLMHTSLDGTSGHDRYAPCSADELLAHGYELWCLGHIHAPFERASDSALAIMPGIPQPRHIGERFGGSVVIAELGDGLPTFERHAVGKLAFAECALDLTECADIQEVTREIRAGLLAVQDPECNVAVRLTATTNQHSADLLTNLAEEELESMDRVYLDKVKSVAPEHKDNSKADDLIRLMREELTEPGLQTSGKQILDDLRAVLPREIADELDENSLTQLYEEAIHEVSLSLHAGGES
ncbi:DNA repair exonuclease [Cohaesibacter sp. CAU 1516]|uniref:metallophosphoesterase family protein n=1 Tax=Cohaesibacter sp. CAU 1516 TaxID=2576038 RepID=UPI0014850BF4|nr:DNA repair exonuclease [Cohaesibacter sp. CAU 1516]